MKKSSKKERTLKDWCKTWSITAILGNHASTAMGFIAEKITQEELLEQRRILAKEIRRRINSLPAKRK